MIDNTVPKKAGVYKISNSIDGRAYIGSSGHLRRRMKEHANDLSKNIHGNKFLQNAYNKYGKENFKFDILEIISFDVPDITSECLRKEKLFIDEYIRDNPEKIYNIELEIYDKPIIKDGKIIYSKYGFKSGNKNYSFGKKTPKELGEATAKRNRERWKDPEYRKKQIERMSGKNSPLYGTKRSEETSKKIREKRLLYCKKVIATNIESGEVFMADTNVDLAKLIKTNKQEVNMRTSKNNLWFTDRLINNLWKIELANKEENSDSSEVMTRSEFRKRNKIKATNINTGEVIFARGQAQIARLIGVNKTAINTRVNTKHFDFRTTPVIGVWKIEML